MRSYVALSIGLALAAVTALALAQDGPAPGRKQLVNRDQVKEFNDTFLRALMTGRPFEAFQLVKATDPDSEGAIDATRQSTESLLDEVRPTYGKPVDFELIDTTTLGESFIRYDYLFKLERSALHYRAIYYKAKPNASWVPVQITFEENLAQLFEDLGKSDNRPLSTNRR